MNYKRNKALFNLLKAAEIYFNSLLKEKYNVLEKILNQEIKTTNETDDFFLPLFFGYVINNNHIIWNIENSDKISIVKKKLFEINKNLLSEFILIVFKHGYKNSCAGWKTLNLPELKYEYIDYKIDFFNNFLHAGKKQQKEFLSDIYSNLFNYLIPCEIHESKNFKSDVLNINTLKNKQKRISFDFKSIKSNIQNDKFPIEIKNLFLRFYDFLEIYYADLFDDLPKISNKIISDIFQKEYDLDDIIEIENIDNLIHSIKLARNGKVKNNWVFNYLHLPYIIAAGKIKEFLILEKQANNKILNTQNIDIKDIKLFSFCIKNENIIKIKNIITNLTFKLNLINNNKTKIEDLHEVLISKGLSKVNKEIHISCETTQFSYIIKQMKPLFHNFNPKTIEKYGLFFSENGTKINSQNIYSNTISNPKEKETIDKIFNEMK